ncbi:PD40 domain-containing protein [Brevibacillus sp. B_LB10_24]|uniref:PD40 domain-containing protein n=1 Tax=Brevibacillus TaxID=55080 RepID=UPI0002E89407|nr:PD40 domain-containing protein [Brevibacillus massiliensis]
MMLKYGTVVLSLLATLILQPLQVTAEQPAVSDETAPPLPMRVSPVTIPARIALVSGNALWIVEGSKPEAKPVKVQTKGSVDAIGWSHDGAWLLYQQRTKEFGPAYLWAAKADGSVTRQVDSQPLSDQASWSPVQNMIAYSTLDPAGQLPEGNLKIATVYADGQISSRVLLPGKSRVGAFAWAPDGKSLAVSLERLKTEPLLIDRVTLAGKRTRLMAEGGPVDPNVGIYPYLASGLTWSPDGKYLAFHVTVSSGSMSADGVAIQLLDTTKPNWIVELGVGLRYPQWLAWSPDSRQLAYIQGGRREATDNKHLFIVDVSAGFAIVDSGMKGYVDTQPRWTAKQPYAVVFARGRESFKMGTTESGGVLVPGQRIWIRGRDGQEQAITVGPDSTADYDPQVSPDCRQLLFMRLHEAHKGSLYVQEYPNGPAVPWLTGLSGEFGYYGNYYPSWIQVFWERPRRSG